MMLKYTLIIQKKSRMFYSFSSKGFQSLLWAQFLSALGDNAIFVAAIALIKQSGAHSGVLESFLQASFLVAYIVLAPYVGRFADGYPKSRVMLQANLLKLFGALAMILGFHPLLSYGIVGVGAAIYSPAKYGILVEMFSEEKLVRANAYLESTTIVAILLGVTLAGKLADVFLPALFWLCAGIYLLAGIINLFVPRIQASSTFSIKKFSEYTKNYLSVFTAFMRQSPALYSIAGTVTFWSVGTTLRLILFVWVPYVFHNNDNALPSLLMGVLSVGIILGAASAGFFIKLNQVKRALIPGVFLGVSIIAIIFMRHLTGFFLLMLVIGFCGGMFVVPLNALIQETGRRSIGSGMALSIQNLCENSGMLIFTLCYSLLLHLSLSLPWIVAILGFLVLVIVLRLLSKNYTVA